MNERLKSLRLFLKLSQQEFSERIKIAQTTYSQFETGKRDLKEIYIMQICQETGVSEKWLRTGEGEMFPQEDADNMELIMRVMAGQEEPKKKLILALARMPNELLKEILSYMDGLSSS